LNRGGDLPSLAAVRDAFGVRRWTAVGGWLLVAAAAYAGALAVNSALAFWLDSTDDLKLADARQTAAAKTEPSSRTSARVLDHLRTQSVRHRADRSPVGRRDGIGRRFRARAAPARHRTGRRSRLCRPRRRRGQPAGRFRRRRGRFRRSEARLGRRRHRRDPRRRTQADARDRHGHSASLAEDHGRERKRGAASAGEGIRQTGANNYLVDRREVEHSVENLNQLSTQMRAVPFIKDGQTIGFRVFNIRAGSLFEKMGLKNGDVIQKVNGVDLDSPTKALALLEDVQTTEELRVDLLRENSPSTLVYTIR
jgi:hypothetical protein